MDGLKGTKTPIVKLEMYGQPAPVANSYQPQEKTAFTYIIRVEFIQDYDIQAVVAAEWVVNTTQGPTNTLGHKIISPPLWGHSSIDVHWLSQSFVSSCQ